MKDATKRCRSTRAAIVIAACAVLMGIQAPAMAGLFDWHDSWRDTEEAPRPAPPPHKPHRHKQSGIVIEKERIPPGPLQIVVSIAKQRATVFANDVRVAEAPISTGVPGHPTPMGVFSVIAKARYHASNIYSGAPMPYMQRITWSGIALHEGPLPGFPASHGCIRLPAAFAIKLWALTKVGVRVIVTRGEAAPVAIESARLFVPKASTEKAAGDITGSTTPVAVAAAGTGAIASDAAKPAETAKPKADARKGKYPVQVFVSRKEGKLYVRQGFEPLFEEPVTIAEPDKPWGTHVFTVTAIKDDKASWTAVTIPSGYVQKPERHGRKLSAKQAERLEKRAADLANAPTAAEALARFDIPKDAADRVSELLSVGSSLIVSDNALSDETGVDTGLIVTTQ